jgi:hypothetical protein
MLVHVGTPSGWVTPLYGRPPMVSRMPPARRAFRARASRRGP